MQLESRFRSASILSNLAAALLLTMVTTIPLAAQSSDPVIDQAKVLMNVGQLEKAVDVLEKSVAAKPKDAVRHYWLGAAYGTAAQQGGMLKAMSAGPKAKDEFEKAVELDPNYLEPRFALIGFYLMAPGFMGGGEEKAKAQANEIKKRDAMQGHRAFVQLAMSSKNLSAARAEFAAAIRENPKSPLPHYWYAVHLMLAEKNYKASGEELVASLHIDPNYAPAHFQIGHLAALSGTNLPAGQEELQKYLGLKPAADEPPLYRAHYWLGVICEKQGNKTEARNHFQAAQRGLPGQKDVEDALKRVS